MRKIRKLLGTASKTQRFSAYTPAAALGNPAPNRKKGRRKSRRITRIQSRQRLKASAWSTLRLVPYALLALAAAGLPLAGYKAYMYLLTSPHFALSAINVNETKHVSRELILEAAGLNPGDNLLRLDEDAAASGILSLPWVKAAQVDLDYPDTVNITVQERFPEALLVDESTYLVDSDGNVFKPMERSDYDSSLLVIAGIGATRLMRMQQAGLVQELVREALAVSRTYEALGLTAYHRLASVDYDDVLGFTLVTTERQRFVLGRGQFADKLHRLRVVLADLAQRDASVEAVHLDNQKQPWRVAVAGTNIQLDSRPAPAAVPELYNELLP